MSTDTPIRLTPEDLLTLPEDGKSYELVDGELVERNVSEDSSWIDGEILFLLRTAAGRGDAGWTFSSEVLFRCFSDDPDRVRKADASFIRREKLPEGPRTVGFTDIVPDLVVEVISPNDVQWQVSEKVSQWLEAGVSVVWEVMPRNRTVTVHRSGSKPEIHCADEEITLPDLIPQFCCRVAEFFSPLPAGRESS